MPSAVLEPPDISDQPRRKRWTREECKALESSGIWKQQKLELINGEPISKMGKNRPHAITESPALAWLIRVFGFDFGNFAAPIDVAPRDNPINEPEPDLIVLSRPSREIRSGNVQPSGLRLMVEVSDSTLGFDLRVKAPLYARAGIQEYWVADIAGRRMIVHRNPREGAYGLVEAYSDQESVAPLAAPESAFAVAEAFPA